MRNFSRKRHVAALAAPLLALLPVMSLGWTYGPLMQRAALFERPPFGVLSSLRFAHGCRHAATPPADCSVCSRRPIGPPGRAFREGRSNSGPHHALVGRPVAPDVPHWRADHASAWAKAAWPGWRFLAPEYRSRRAPLYTRGGWLGVVSYTLGLA